MKLNNICCIGGDILGRTICISIAYKYPEIRVIVLDDEKTNSERSSFAIYDPHFDQILKKCWHRNLFFSSYYESAIKEADLIFLSVNVPIKTFKERKEVIVDFSELEEATKLIALYSESDKVVVDKSDIPVKAAEKISWILKSTSRTGFQFRILSVPSYINEKSSVEEILHPERIVIGCDCNPAGRAAAQSLSEVYENWVPKKNILIVSHWSAGLYKLISISFLALKQCSINTIMTICEESGADLSEILYVLSRDSKIGPKYLKPSVVLEPFQDNISKLLFMCELLKLNETGEYWEALLEVNQYFMNRFYERAKIFLGSVEGKEITVWGFEKIPPKKNRFSTLTIHEWLIKEKSKLRIYDPEFEAQQILKELKVENIDEKERNVQIYTDIYLSIHNATALVIWEKREEFFDLDYCKLTKWMKRPLVIDRFRLYENLVMSKHGIQYFTLGSKIEKDITP